jgi:hypothetical protein
MTDHGKLAAALEGCGYRLIEDCWLDQGRRTYLNSEDADLAEMRALHSAIAPLGWLRDGEQLRAWHLAGEVIEIEPGGPDCSGHYLHHMRAQREGAE